MQVLGVLLGAAAFAQAQLARYEFNDSTYLVIDTNASSTASNLSAGDIDVTPGGFVSTTSAALGNPIPAILSDASFPKLNRATAADALAENDYIGFTINPDTGHRLDPASFQIDAQAIYGTSTTAGDETEWAFGLFSSVNGFDGTEDMIGSPQSISLTSTGTASQGGYSTLTFDTTSLGTQPSSVEFRLYIWTPTVTGSGPRNNRRLTLDNITLNGDVIIRQLSLSVISSP